MYLDDTPMLVHDLLFYKRCSLTAVRIFKYRLYLNSFSLRSKDTLILNIRRMFFFILLCMTQNRTNGTIVRNEKVAMFIKI